MPDAPVPRALSAAQLRELDRRALEEFGLPGCVLMENAGAGAARALLAACRDWTLGAATRVAILCGAGNNGGDGAVLARHISNAGLRPTLLYTVSSERELAGDALLQHRVVSSMRLPLLHAPSLGELEAQLAQHLVCVDALLGTGARGAPRAPAADWIRALNQRRAAGARTLALDLPSGFEADSGQAHDPTVESDLTVTFAAPKLGFGRAGAERWLGEVQCVDIGVPRMLFPPA